MRFEREGSFLDRLLEQFKKPEDLSYAVGDRYAQFNAVILRIKLVQQFTIDCILPVKIKSSEFL
ncbi:MAG: hypothetical protein ACMUJM_23460 [bacterium]